MHRVYLSRRNLQVLLNKLDRRKAGDHSYCTLIKRDNVHPKYPQTLDEIEVVAVEDEEYYTERSSGYVHTLDTPK